MAILFSSVASCGQRHYSTDQLNRLILVRRSRELGFSLDEVRAMLVLVDNDQMTCGQIHKLTIAHLQSVREKLADLRKMERALKNMAGQCSQGDVPDCAIIDMLYSVETPR
ncbi:MAG: MerR family DNA-binding protein [Burkholderiaceae bacterium]